MKIFFYNVPGSFLQIFAKVGIDPIAVDEIPIGETQATIIWYAKTELDVMRFEEMTEFNRKIILGAEALTLESPSVMALLLRQANVEMYYPFLASHITKILDSERHWLECQVSNYHDNFSSENVRIENSLNKGIDSIIERLVGTITISVGNIQHGSGATHTALTVAKYLSLKGFRVAVVELKQRTDYGLIYLPRKVTCNQYSFKYEGFDIYANDGEATPDDLLIAAMSKNYNYIVIDVGLIFEHDFVNAKLDKPKTLIKNYEKGNFYNDFMKADVKIVNTFASTQFADSIEYLMNYLHVWNITDLKILFNYTNEEILKGYRKLLDSKIFLTPYNSTLALTEDQEDFYGKLLEKFIPKNKTVKEGMNIGRSVRYMINLIGEGVDSALKLVRR